MRFDEDAPEFIPQERRLPSYSSLDEDAPEFIPQKVRSTYRDFLSTLGNTYSEFMVLSNVDKINNVRRISYKDIIVTAFYAFDIQRFSMISALTRQEMIIKLEKIPVISSSEQDLESLETENALDSYGTLNIEEVKGDNMVVGTNNIEMSNKESQIQVDMPLFYLQRGDSVRIKMYLVKSFSLNGDRWNCISSFLFSKVKKSEDENRLSPGSILLNPSLFELDTEETEMKSIPDENLRGNESLNDEEYGMYLVRIQTRGNIHPSFIQQMIEMSNE